jgi:hypothetical protein
MLRPQMSSPPRAISRGEAVCPPQLGMRLVKWVSVKAREELAPCVDSKSNLTLRQMQLVVDAGTRYEAVQTVRAQLDEV